MNIKEFATAYEPQKMKLISDLDSVEATIEFQTEVRENREKEKYTINFIVVEGEEYRVPISVIEQLKVILSANPDLKTFKVSKIGEGLNSRYTAIPIN
tara:strand:- start:4715 stop:5008 length:294 start_codon:yes stop_codon:yes gene_type:complete